MALGWQLNPMFAAAAMSLSSICVVSNALRLKFFRPEHGARGSDEEALQKEAEPSAHKEEIKTRELDYDDSSQIGGMKNRKEEKTMAKHETELKIEGMMCQHCKAHVEKTLNGLQGAQAEVDLDAGTAIVRSEQEIADDTFKATIEDAGYELKGIERK